MPVEQHVRGHRAAARIEWESQVPWQLNCTIHAMNQPSSVPKQPKTQELRPEQWIPLLAEFTRENRGAHARLDVLGGDVGYQVQTENRPFDGVAADVKHGEHNVWISFGSTADDHLTHGIHNATVIRIVEPTKDGGAVLEVEAQDGTTTVLELSNPEAYALPQPSGSHDSR